MPEQELRKNDNSLPIPNNQQGCVKIFQGCLLFVGGLSILIFVTITTFLLTGIMTFNNLTASIGNFLGQPATATVTSTRTIISGIQPLGQLVSVSVEVAQADINVSIDSGGLNLCNHNANHVAQGALEAGVNITGLDVEDIQYDELTDTYTITLPAPTITSCRIEYIRQYERSGANPTCGYDWDNVRLLAQYQTTLLFVDETLEAGILSRAERESTLTLETFIQALTGSEVEILFHEIDEETALPPSCQPQLPNGWQFDEEINAWTESQ